MSPAECLAEVDLGEILAAKLREHLRQKRLVAISHCQDCLANCGEYPCAAHDINPRCMTHGTDLDDAGICGRCEMEDA